MAQVLRRTVTSGAVALGLIAGGVGAAVPASAAAPNCSTVYNSDREVAFVCSTWNHYQEYQAVVNCGPNGGSIKFGNWLPMNKAGLMRCENIKIVTYQGR